MIGRGTRQMNATLESYEEPLRRIADEFMASLAVKGARKQVGKKPLGRVQEYLDELEHCTEKLTKVLLKVKELVIVTALISVFLWGVIDLFIRLGV